MQILKMDFQSQSTPPVVPVMQSDAQSRFIGIALYDGGAPYAAPENAAYTVQYHGPGPNNIGWYDTITLSSGTRKAVTVDSTNKNIITLELAEQALRVNGNVFINLCVVTSTGYMLHTFPILCRVTGAAYIDPVAVRSFFYVTGITSEQWLAYVTACQDAQKRAEDAAAKLVIDDTLSLSGKAADAAKVGTSLAEETTRAKAAEEENAKGVSQLKEDLVAFSNYQYSMENVLKNKGLESGGVEVYSDTYSATPFLPVLTNTKLFISGSGYDYGEANYFYDIDKNMVSNFIIRNSNQGYTEVDIPKNAYYFRIAYPTNTIKNIIIKGYGTVQKNTNDIQRITNAVGVRINIDLLSGANNGHFVYDNLSIGTVENFSISPILAVKKGEVIKFNVYATTSMSALAKCDSGGSPTKKILNGTSSQNEYLWKADEDCNVIITYANTKYQFTNYCEIHDPQSAFALALATKSQREFEPNITVFGDSIMENANEGFDGWGTRLKEIVPYNKFVAVSIGGTRFRHGKTIKYPDGFKNGDSLGNIDGSNSPGDLPSGFCDWYRIDLTIPEDSDIIILGTGVNDLEPNWVQPNAGDYSFSSENAMDSEWVNSEYYSQYNGDYNINTIKGAFMSAIMKLQAKAPNAKIFWCNWCNSRGDTGKKGTDTKNKVDNDMLLSMLSECANLCGIEIIDLFGESGINPMNRDIYIADSIHPNVNGYKKKVAPVIIAKLLNYIKTMPVN